MRKFHPLIDKVFTEHFNPEMVNDRDLQDANRMEFDIKWAMSDLLLKLQNDTALKTIIGQAGAYAGMKEDGGRWDFGNCHDISEGKELRLLITSFLKEMPQP